MNASDLQFVGSLLHSSAGLVVGPDKSYLLESRLAPVARKHGLGNVGELVKALRGMRRDSVLRDTIEAMTTNESFFFRDGRPFEALRDLVLPELLRRRSATRTLRIWCAAASTGQEPYSIAILLQEEAAKLAGWRCQILATDLSTEALDRAKAGLYNQFEAQRGLSIQRLIRHFDQEGQQWRVKPALRAAVEFRPFNLLHPPASLGRFDIVFCRNVLIYFDQPTKARVLRSIADVMEEDGTLFLGGAETTFGITAAFQPVPKHHGIYRPSPTPAAAAPVAAAARS